MEKSVFVISMLGCLLFALEPLMFVGFYDFSYELIREL